MHSPSLRQVPGRLPSRCALPTPSALHPCWRGKVTIWLHLAAAGTGESGERKTGEPPRARTGSSGQCVPGAPLSGGELSPAAAEQTQPASGLTRPRSREPNAPSSLGPFPALHLNKSQASFGALFELGLLHQTGFPDEAHPLTHGAGWGAPSGCLKCKRSCKTARTHSCVPNGVHGGYPARPAQEAFSPAGTQEHPPGFFLLGLYRSHFPLLHRCLSVGGAGGRHGFETCVRHGTQRLSAFTPISHATRCSRGRRARTTLCRAGAGDLRERRPHRDNGAGGRGDVFQGSSRKRGRCSASQDEDAGRRAPGTPGCLQS